MLQEGEAYDSPRVKAQVGPVATMVLHDAMEAQNYGSVLGEFAGSGAPDPGLEQIFRSIAPSTNPIRQRTHDI